MSQRTDAVRRMPARSERIEPTHEWRQLAFRVRADGQRTYELIRPVVLFGHSPAERAAETGAAERTLYRQVARFAQLGMASFVPPPKVEKHRTLPAPVRQAILDAKREHPPLNVNEIRTICWARFAHRPSNATVKRVLAKAPPPPRTHRRFPPFHAIADPAQRRLAIVRLHIEGWLRFVSSKPAGAPSGDGEPGKEAYRTWATGRSMWDAIPHRCGEQRNASPPR